MVSAVRGSVVTFKNDPFLHPVDECITYEPDAVIVIDQGIITAFGAADEILPGLSSDIEVECYYNALILPGFIDCHVHYPQTEIIGAYGKQLIDWLNNYAYVAEQNFSDKAYATQAARTFLRECLRAGTTTASVFCTVFPDSVEAFFEESEKLNMRNIAGKVLMDQNAPDNLKDTPQSGYDDTKRLIERWHERGRQLYAITPRFALSSSPQQMEVTGALWREHAGTYLQSHLSESRREVDWVRRMYPQQADYVDVYDHYGQLGPRSIYGHGIHLSETEMQRLHDTGTALAHCPTSNLFLGSGLFSLERMKDSARPVRMGLATDLGAGTSFSQLITMNEAYKVARMTGYSLSAVHAFYLATQGAAHALYLGDKIGSIAVGNEADMTVLNLYATPILEHRMQYVGELEEMLFVLMTLGDDRAVEATYVAGEKVYSRAAAIAGKELPSTLVDSKPLI